MPDFRLHCRICHETEKRTIRHMACAGCDKFHTCCKKCALPLSKAFGEFGSYEVKLKVCPEVGACRRCQKDKEIGKTV